MVVPYFTHLCINVFECLVLSTVGSNLERCYFYLAFDGQFIENEGQNISGYLQGLLLIWCVSSPPVHLLSPV